MTELNVFEDATSGYLVLENEGRVVKATPQQAIGLLASLARRFGYSLTPIQQEQDSIEKNRAVSENNKEKTIEVAQESEENVTEEESDDLEVEELFDDSPVKPTSKLPVKKSSGIPSSTRPLNVAKQVEAKMMQQRSPGKIGMNF